MGLEKDRDFNYFVKQLNEGNTEEVMNSLIPPFVNQIINKWKESPIHVACQNGYTDIVKLLLANNCYVECTDFWSRRPIHYACSKGHVKIVQLLLSKDCSIECEDEWGWRPIHDSCQGGHVDIVQLLIHNQCNLSCRTKDGLTALHLANQCDEKSCVKLLKHLIKLPMLFTHIRADCLKSFIRYYRNYNIATREYETGLSVLKVALMSKANEIIKYIVQKPIEDKEMFYFAKALKGLHNSQDLNIQSSEHNLVVPNAELTPLLTTRENVFTLSLKIYGFVPVCLLDVIDVNIANMCDGKNNSLLHLAAKYLQPGLCRCLLKAGAKVDRLNNDGNTSLLELFSNNANSIPDDNCDKCIEIVKILIEYGADIYKTSSNGTSVFQCAISKYQNQNLMIALVEKLSELKYFYTNDFLIAFKNQWFLYGEILLRVLPIGFLHRNITSEIFQLSMNDESPSQHLIKPLFLKAKHQLSQYILEALLYWSANKKYDEIFDFLIKTKVSSPKLSKNGENLLTSLLKEKKVEFVWKLLESINKENYVNYKNSRNQLALQFAIEMEDIDLINYLIQETNEFNYEDENKTCPMNQLLEKISICDDKPFQTKLLMAIKSMISLGANIYMTISNGGKQVIDFCTAQSHLIKTEIEQFFKTTQNRFNQKIKAMNEDKGTCPVCLDKLINTVLQCGHVFCNHCAGKVTKCPVCKIQIKQKIRIYLY